MAINSLPPASGGTPEGQTAGRPSNPIIGKSYFNGSLGILEIFTAGGWFPVNSIPGNATSLVATDVGTSRAFNNGAASVAFTGPTNGGYPVSYTAISTPGSFTTSGSTSPLVVSGLQSATSYTFTVRSSNQFGTSSDSVSSAAVTSTTVPSAPTIGTAVNYDSGTAQVSFTAGANGGKAQAFQVTSSPGGVTASGSSSPIAISGLTNGTAYTFTVTGSNSNGTSQSSSASNSVTPRASNPFTTTLGTFNTLYEVAPAAPSGAHTVTVSPSTSTVWISFFDNSNAKVGACQVTGGSTSVTLSGDAAKAVMFANTNSSITVSVGSNPITKTTTTLGTAATPITITSSTSYTGTSTSGFAFALAVGGGGGGQGGNHNCCPGSGGGGGSGGHVGEIVRLTGAVTATIGALGAGGGCCGQAGNSGGDTVFGPVTGGGGGVGIWGGNTAGNGTRGAAGTPNGGRGGAANDPYSGTSGEASAASPYTFAVTGTTGGGSGGSGGSGAGSGIGTGGNHQASANGYGGGGGRNNTSWETGGNGSQGVVYLVRF
jgi:hypothetical protein